MLLVEIDVHWRSFEYDKNKLKKKKNAKIAFLHLLIYNIRVLAEPVEILLFYTYK